MKRQYICKGCKTIYNNPNLKYCDKCGGIILVKKNYFVRLLIICVLLLMILLALPIYQFFNPHYSKVELYGRTILVDGEMVVLNEENLETVYIIRDEEEKGYVRYNSVFSKTCEYRIDVVTDFATMRTATVFYKVYFDFNGWNWEITGMGEYPDEINYDYERLLLLGIQEYLDEINYDYEW